MYGWACKLDGSTEIIIAGLHIEVAGGASIEEAEQIANGVMHRIHTENKDDYCVIHVEAQKKSKS